MSTPALSDFTFDDLMFDSSAFDVNVTAAVLDATVTFSIDGASTIAIVVDDPTRTLLRSGVFSAKVRTQVDQWSMELVQVRKQDSRLTCVFEDLAIARLRTHDSLVSIAAGAMTRVQFIEKLIHDDEPWINVFAPVLGALTQEPLSRGQITTSTSSVETGVPGATNTSAQPVVQAIIAATADPNVQIAMLLGSSLEGGWGPTYSVGDFGTSFGPFQIHLPAHPGVTRAQAEDPVWAVQYMLPSYEAGVRAQPASLWSSDPCTAAEQAAVAAERPAKSYFASQGAAKVQASFNMAYEAAVSAKTTQGVVSGSAVGNAPADAAEQAVKFSLAQVGKPYIWGGVGPSGFDCSGLCYAAYKSAGTTIPRTSQAQWSGLPHVDLSQLLPGDLIFYAGSDGTPTAPGHVVMCIGNGQMVQAEETGTNIFTGIIPHGAIGAARPVGAITGGKASGTASGSPSTNLEDTWTCITRLASEVQWRCFVASPGVVSFVPDTYLLSVPPFAVVQELSGGVDNIDFDFDEGKTVATVVITCHSDQWEVPLGSTFKIQNCGPADGIWIVSQIQRSLFSTLTTVTCIQPEPALPEPIAGQPPAELTLPPVPGQSPLVTSAAPGQRTASTGDVATTLGRRVAGAI